MLCGRSRRWSDAAVRVQARLLLSFLSVRPEEAADCREPIGEVLALAEADGDEVRRRCMERCDL